MSADLERFEELSSQFSALADQLADCLETQRTLEAQIRNVWTEKEQIKNRHNGMPPTQ